MRGGLANASASPEGRLMENAGRAVDQGPPSPRSSEVAQKKLKKRLQLKNLIVTKFRNKYCASVSDEDDLNNFIQSEVDSLFAMEMFDERDLIAVDRKVRQYIAQKKGLQKDKQEGASSTGAAAEPVEGTGAKRATIATARLLDGRNN